MKRRKMSVECEMDHSYAIPNINDNSNALLKKIQNVYTNKLLNDITLLVGGVPYPAHRFMLCISSDVFETMLMNTKWSDSYQEVVELQEIQQCIEVFPIFLKYFYTGVITLEQSNIMPMLVLADKYNVKDLTLLCVEYMCDHIADAADQGQLVTWFQYVLSLNQPSQISASYYCKIWQDSECFNVKSPWNKLLKACRNYIKWNLDSCTKCFNTFQCDVLVGLLQQSDVVVHDEMQLFGCVASWLNYQSAEKQIECNDPDFIDEYMSSLTRHVMSYIRYPMILPRQMAQLLMLSIVKQNKDFFVDKMAAAMEYTLVNYEKNLNKTFGEHILECTPRLYTSCKLRWGKLFRVRTKSIQNYQSIKREILTSSNLFDRDHERNEESQWEIELFLKGICYEKSLLMTWRGSVELPEVVIKTIRATVKLKLRPDEFGKISRHVRVAILIYGVQNKVPHVITVVQKIASFDSNQNIIRIDDLMVFEGINSLTSDEEMVHINDTNVSYFMPGQPAPLKLHVIITPIVQGLTDTHIGTRIQSVHF
ncbi:BTB/POZ domain-containing protein 17-like [Daktulosphaira vitifoliae]|uniref:BTB/POZ domain-containing protein 17-like n=1 Tax=Daktulosphaira vitifoliae TaxID=58002 RepID=UPI0021A98260|nr:BTB/POZ domain-containing protein 17-like [Daktulosphaira vitifoliae]XP_050542511.1 BTB/POZ domain-containing protein 17-like [Daktulosphaira vitifoliae]